MYRWTDASGTLHITENLANVPTQQRTAASSRKPSEARGVQYLAGLKTRRSHVAALSISSLRRSSPGQTASVGQEIPSSARGT